MNGGGTQLSDQEAGLKRHECGAAAVSAQATVWLMVGRDRALELVTGGGYEHDGASAVLLSRLRVTRQRSCLRPGTEPCSCLRPVAGGKAAPTVAGTGAA